MFSNANALVYKLFAYSEINETAFCKCSVAFALRFVSRNSEALGLI